MHGFRHRTSHDDLFLGKWRARDIIPRQHGGGRGGGRGGGSGGGSGGRGNGESGGNRNRGDNGNNNDNDRGGRGGSSGNGNSGGRGSGNGNSNGNGQGDDSGDDNNDNNNNNNSGGNSNSGGDAGDEAKSSTKTQKKTTAAAAAARTSTKSPSKATSTSKAKAAATPTKEAASPVQTKKVDASTSTPSPKSKSPNTADAAESPATQETEATQATDRGSSPSSNSQATDLPVAVTAGSSGGSGLSSGATQVAGAPGRTTQTPSSQSPASGGGGHNGSANVGGIVAGVVVGIIALLVLIFLGWRFRRSKVLAPVFSRFQSKGDDTQVRQAMSSSPNMGESLIIGAGAMARGRGDGNRSPPAYEETKAALEPAVTPLAQPVAAVTRSRSHRTHQSTGSIHRKPVPAAYADRPRPAPSMVENPNRVPISLMPGPMRIRRATSPSSSTRSPPPYQDGARGGPGVSRPPATKWTANNLPVPPPEPQGRESSDIGDRRTTNHSGWSSLLPTSGDAADADARRRDSFVSVGGVSIASSGVISPSVLNWPMPPSTPPSMSVTNLSDDSRQSVQGTSLRAPEQSKAARRVYQSPVQIGPSRINRPGATGPSQMGDGAEVLTASTITFQQPSRTVVRVQRRSTQSSTPSSTPSSERSEPRQTRGR